VDIEVLDELGLTSQQRAYATALGACIGIVGTLFALPFIARLFKKESDEAK